MADNNRTTSSSDEILLINNSSQREVMPKVYVEPCQTEFFYDKFKQSYPMFKNPRGMCLIVNIYQIDNMPPRRWSNRDTESLKQLFEQLLFTVKAYTDFTHDLGCQVIWLHRTLFCNECWNREIYFSDKKIEWGFYSKKVLYIVLKKILGSIQISWYIDMNPRQFFSINY